MAKLYGIMTMRNGIPMINFLTKREYKINKKLCRKFFDKYIFATMCVFTIDKKADIRKVFDFFKNDYFKLVSATTEEWYIKQKGIKDEYRRIDT